VAPKKGKGRGTASALILIRRERKRAAREDDLKGQPQLFLLEGEKKRKEKESPKNSL